MPKPLGRLLESEGALPLANKLEVSFDQVRICVFPKLVVVERVVLEETKGKKKRLTWKIVNRGRKR